MKLRSKILFFTASLLLTLGLALVVFVKTSLTNNLLSEFKKNGISLTKNLAEMSISNILTEQYINLQMMITDYKINNSDINYIFVLNANKDIIATTIEGDFPLQLKNANLLNSEKEYNIQLLSIGEILTYDIGVLVLGGHAGYLHIGFSKTSLMKSVNNIVRLIIDIFIGASFLSGIVAFLFASITTKPLLDLAEVSLHVAKGNFDRKALVSTSDEIGQLGEIFNRMIFDLRKSHEGLEKQNKQLIKLDKMKDSLVSDVSHELKTPLAKQEMQLELMKRFLQRHGLLEECSKIIKTMISSIRRQEMVIHNILDLSRLEAGGKKYKIKPVQLNLLIREVLDDYRAIIEANEIELNTNLVPITINSDKDMLFHVLANVVNNAIKYRSQIAPPTLVVHLEENGKDIIIRVIDNGIGMSAEEEHHVFERFFQASASAEGSGVGLTITQKIVNDLGGKIWLESEGPEKGTTVTVQFPL